MKRILVAFAVLALSASAFAAQPQPSFNDSLGLSEASIGTNVQVPQPSFNDGVLVAQAIETLKSPAPVSTPVATPAPANPNAPLPTSGGTVVYDGRGEGSTPTMAPAPVTSSSKPGTTDAIAKGWVRY